MPTVVASPEELVTLGFLAVIVSIIVQVTKKWIPEDIIPLFAIGVGMALALVVGILALSMRTPTQIAVLAFTGFLSGATAIGYYEAQSNKVMGAKK
jgi:hypothetical protein